MRRKSKKPDTIFTRAGRNPEAQQGAVNPPVYHASTILFPTVAALEDADRHRFDRLYYGRHGTPTTFAFEEAMAEVEEGYRAVAFGSGVAACTAAILSSVRSGDHVLMTDAVYGPVRAFCTGFLARFGVTTSFYDPEIGSAIDRLITPSTRLIYMESPGSLTFEVQDVPAMVAVAKAHGIRTALDNTWGAPLFFKPLAFGIDISLVAATKYIVGHADAMMGAAVCGDEKSWKSLRQAAAQLGHHVAPDDCYLALRGLRTAGVRLRQHEVQGLALAHWLKDRPEVERILHPALPEAAGHALWQRDFTGACGLFGFVLKREISQVAIAAMLDGMTLFGMGWSWGGFESLLLPVHPEQSRTAVPWTAGPTLRLHAGLEALDDLIADLEEGFARLNAAI